MPLEQLITRSYFWLLPTWAIKVIYLFILGSVVIGLILSVRRGLGWNRGRQESGEYHKRERLKVAWKSFVEITGHSKLFRDLYAGLMHLSIFYGSLGLFIGTVIIAIDQHTPLHFFYGRFYQTYSLLINLAGLVFVLGVCLAVWRRYIQRLSRLESSALSTIFIWNLLLLGLGGFLLSGIRISIDLPAHDRVRFIGYTIALGVRSLNVNRDFLIGLYKATYAIHIITAGVFFILLSAQIYRHIWAAPASMVLRLPTILDSEALGTNPTRRQLIAQDACVACGRCQDVCPAQMAKWPLSPRMAMLIPSLSLAADSAWACTTCAACIEACPAELRPMDSILHRRAQLVEVAELPLQQATTLESIYQSGSPWNTRPSQRMEWTSGLDIKIPVAKPGQKIETLYWVGCASSGDAKAGQIARAVALVLQAAGIEYSILGEREECCGDPALRLGEEGLFRMMAERNFDLMQSHRVQHLITHCPHCYHMFRHEYRRLGADFEVVHHSQLIAGIIDDGLLSMRRALRGIFTYHDPCYLGRRNGIYEEPRQVMHELISSGGAFREIAPTGQDALCCGGGGGHAWMDIHKGNRLEDLRIAQALETASETLATSCPFCRIMLGSAAESHPLQVRDIAELVVDSL